jgi:hypothetical protein
LQEQGGKTKSCEIEALRAGGGQACSAKNGHRFAKKGQKSQLTG